MFRNYLTVALRNLYKQKAYSFINITGLAIGLTCSTLILLYLQHEFSYDRHHKKADRIHRVIAEKRLPNGDISYPYAVQGPVAPTLAEDFPEIERATRFYLRTVSIRLNNTLHLRNEVIVTDQNYFNIFDCPLIKGDTQTGLQTPYTIFITQTLAHKLFGQEDPIGKTILLESKWYNDTYTITGILKDIPKTSTVELSPDLITTTFPTYRAGFIKNLQHSWRTSFAYTYILLKPNTDPTALTEKLPAFAERHLGEETAQTLQYKLLPLTKLHLEGRNYGLFFNTRNINIYAFGLIGIFILTVACINFMNLSTARSARRMREVGMRKVVGAKRTQLIFQFLGESILLSTLALILSIGLTKLTLPLLNGFMDVHLSINIQTVFVLFILTIGVGLLSGSYPALFLSSFKPTAVLKSAPNTKGSHVLVRKGLVVVQFAISMILVAATIIVYQQTKYMRTADLGFNADTLIEMRGLWGVKTQAEAMKAQYLQHPDVQNVTILNRLIGGENNTDQMLVSSQEQTNPIQVHYMYTDQNFLNTYGISLQSGRNFTVQDFTDYRSPRRNVMLNETAAKRLNIQAGDYINFRGTSRKVIGIFKDFHNRSLHATINPLMLFCSRNDNQIHMTLRINTHNLPEVMAHLEAAWNKFHPDRPSQFVFVNASYDKQYQTEIRQQKLYATCSALAIVIACLGLLGLIAYTAEVRTKEIGVRKVLGATETNIVGLLTKEFLMLVVLASVLAYPIIYYTMNNWLQNFAYRIDLHLMYFILSTGITLLMTCITITYQALKAARTNPVDALRNLG